MESDPPSSSQISTLTDEIEVEGKDVKSRIELVEPRKIFTLGRMSAPGGKHLGNYTSSEIQRPGHNSK